MTAQDVQDVLCDSLDTGQEAFQLDTGQIFDATDVDHSERLVILDHEIHRVDERDDGGQELIISTLKYFHIRVGLQTPEGEPILDSGIPLIATLLYENGRAVQDMSATLEPPLLGGEADRQKPDFHQECCLATLKEGVAAFRLRITVLSSLCSGKRFRVCVAAVGSPSHRVTTNAVKTITKLRRGDRKDSSATGGGSLGSARDHGTLAEELLFSTLSNLSTPLTSDARFSSNVNNKRSALCLLDERIENATSNQLARIEAATTPLADACGKSGPETVDVPPEFFTRPIGELWDELAANGKRLRELQAEQERLFLELRQLRKGEEHRKARAATIETNMVGETTAEAIGLAM